VKTAVIYARHSTDKQETSCLDQIERCEKYCHVKQYQIRGIFFDEAVSGSMPIHTRKGITDLINAVIDDNVDLVITEDLSRLSRDQGDIANFYKKVVYLSASIETIEEGKISELHIGLKGTMNALQLQMISDKTRRGTLASVQKGTWKTVAEKKTAIENRLNKLFPDWRRNKSLLEEHGLSPFDIKSWKQLPSIEDPISISVKFINRHTASALFKGNPKTSFNCDELTLTKDFITRIRASEGLKLSSEGGEVVDAWILSSICGEICLPDRFWLSNIQNIGRKPKLIMTVENLGAFVDMPRPEGVMLVFAPGENWQEAYPLVSMFPDVKWVHFPDFDPKGLKIANDMATAFSKNCAIYIPSFWKERIKRKSTPKSSWDAEVPIDHPLIKMLMEKNKGIHQEHFLLDDRMADDLIKLRDNQD